VAGNMTPDSWPRWRSATLCLEAVYFMGTLFNVRAWFEANKQKKGGVADPQLPAWLVASILLYIATGPRARW
jgi:hypothetical protein